MSRIGHRIFLVAIAFAMMSSVVVDDACALDRIRDRNGVTSGKISKMSVLAVTLKKGGVETKVPVEEIVSITFDGEPDDLSPARRAAENGRYEDALNKLSNIDYADVERSEVKQEINFLTTYCKVQLALSGQGTLENARKQVAGFLSKNNKSYRVPRAIELLGDVLSASGDYEGARAQYAKLGKAPAPYFKARSALLAGRTLQAEGSHQQAVDSFDKALKAADGNAAAQSQVLEATLAERGEPMRLSVRPRRGYRKPSSRSIKEADLRRFGRCSPRPTTHWGIATCRPTRSRKRRTSCVPARRSPVQHRHDCRARAKRCMSSAQAVG